MGLNDSKVFRVSAGLFCIRILVFLHMQFGPPAFAVGGGSISKF